MCARSSTYTRSRVAHRDAGDCVLADRQNGTYLRGEISMGRSDFGGVRAAVTLRRLAYCSSSTAGLSIFCSIDPHKRGVSGYDVSDVRLGSSRLAIIFEIRTCIPSLLYKTSDWVFHEETVRKQIHVNDVFKIRFNSICIYLYSMYVC